MTCSLSKSLIEQAIAFHGHTCPGIMIGIRVSELALRRLGDRGRADLVAVVETDMCGVDAIQVITGCTFGKGDLIHLDYGKMAFTFFDRKTGRGFRALLNQAVREKQEKRIAAELKTARPDVPEEELPWAGEFRSRLQDLYLHADLEELFVLTEPAAPPPRPAKVLASLQCAGCGEMVMESRARMYGGKILCIPCFREVEQKLVR